MLMQKTRKISVCGNIKMCTAAHSTIVAKLQHNHNFSPLSVFTNRIREWIKKDFENHGYLTHFTIKYASYMLKKWVFFRELIASGLCPFPLFRLAIKMNKSDNEFYNKPYREL